jgi:antitoxin component of MazEF toxin-antitoxin module
LRLTFSLIETDDSFENRIIRFGNEFFLALPQEIVSSMTLKDGDEFLIEIKDDTKMVLIKKD